METNETQNSSDATAGGKSAPQRYAQLQALVAGMADDFSKFYNDGNKAAGTRVRNSMQALKTLAQEIRTEVQTIKNEGKGGAAAGGDDKADAEGGDAD